METKKYNFYITFCFFVYFVFTGHYVLMNDKDTIISYYSEFGFYFYSLLICIYAISYLFKKYMPQHISLNSFLSNITTKPAVIIVFSLIISHILELFHPIMKLISYLSFKTAYHENLILFIIGMFIFTLGAYLIKKKQNKMVLITACMIMFIHGFYMCLFWHSTNEQYKAYEDFYTTSVNNNIPLKECGEKIACFNIYKEKFVETVLLIPQSIEEEKAHLLVKNYVLGFIEEFKKNQDKNIPLTLYSYGDSLKYFLNKSYGAIGLYNSENGMFILDYQHGSQINHEHEKTYKKLTGVATLLWTGLLLLLLFFHNTFIIYRRKKILRKSHVE